MNEHRPTDPASLPDDSTLNNRVTAAVRSYQRRIQVLTGVALLLGFLAVAASAVIVSSYYIFYRPKEKEVLLQTQLAADRAKSAPNADAGAKSGAALPFDFPSVQATMTFFHSVIIATLAGAVGLLAAGTLLLHLVVIFGRRATLSQINTGLAQISDQLKDLQRRESRP